MHFTSSSDVPSAPQGLTVAATNTTAVVLNWSPPQDSGGTGVVFYTVYYQSVKMTLGNITTTFVTVTNLSPATEYMMTVVAKNGVTGDEANSSVSIAVTTQSMLVIRIGYSHVVDCIVLSQPVPQVPTRVYREAVCVFHVLPTVTVQ